MAAYYTEVPTTLPVVLTLDNAKKQLKVEDLGTFDDVIIQDCVDAAVEEAEQYTNTAIYERKYVVKSNAWLKDFEFRIQPVQSVTKITYIKEDGTSVEVSSAEDLAAFMELLPKDKYAKIIHLKNADDLPDLKTKINDALTIEITCGYAATKVPKSMVQGIKLLVSDNYNFRGDSEKKTNSASRRKLEPFKYYSE